MFLLPRAPGRDRAQREQYLYMARLRRVKQADVLKIAWKAESIYDAIEALKITARLGVEDGRPAVALAMGEEGVISRLLARKFGAAFMFASL